MRYYDLLIFRPVRRSRVLYAFTLDILTRRIWITEKWEIVSDLLEMPNQQLFKIFRPSLCEQDDLSKTKLVLVGHVTIFLSWSMSRMVWLESSRLWIVGKNYLNGRKIWLAVLRCAQSWPSSKDLRKRRNGKEIRFGDFNFCRRTMLCTSCEPLWNVPSL